jgi:hypothetical protein
MNMKGFSKQWCAWIEGVISGGHVRIKVNDDVRAYIQMHKDLRNPLSPILFKLTIDMLAILIS